MSLIRSLTGPQRSALDDTIRHWSGIARSTASIDREAARQAVSDLYRAAGYAPPRFLLVSSPAACPLAWRMLYPGEHAGEVGDLLSSNLRWQFADERDDHLYIEIHGLARQQVSSAVLKEIRDRTASVLQSTPWGPLSGEIEAQSGAGADLQSELVSADLSRQIGEQLGWRVTPPAPASMQEWMRLRLHALAGGWGPWVEVMGDFLMRLGVQFPPQLAAKIQLWLRVAEQCQRWLPCGKLAILTDRPCVLQTDEQGRLHGTTGPALAYRDHVELFAVHGVQVPSLVIEHPEQISPAMINTTANAEVRRILIERFGIERYLRVGHAIRVDRDRTTGTLWHKHMRGDETLAMVEVLNSSPEPDGTYKTYFLRVPPDCRSAREAVAWTFGMEGSQYRPGVET